MRAFVPSRGAAVGVRVLEVVLGLRSSHPLRLSGQLPCCPGEDEVGSGSFPALVRSPVLSGLPLGLRGCGSLARQGCRGAEVPEAGHRFVQSLPGAVEGGLAWQEEDAVALWGLPRPHSERGLGAACREGWVVFLL